MEYKKKIFIFIGIILFFLVSCDKEPYSHESAKNGVLDLSDWDFRSDGIGITDGEWEFYWKEFLTSSDFQTKDVGRRKVIISAPKYWNHLSIDGKQLDCNGYGTFRLIVKIPDKKYDVLAIAILPQLTAYKLFVNGKKVATSGKVGTSKAESEACFDRKIVSVPADTSQLELILHISNYHHANGGLQHNAKIGLTNQIIEIEKQNTLVNSLLLGSIFIIAVYHLGLYFIRRKSLSALFFAVFCLLIFIRVFIASNHFEVYLGKIKWEVVIFLELFSFVAAIPAFIAYISQIFKKLFYQTISCVIYGVSAFLIAVLLFTSPQFYLSMLPYLEIWIIINVVYVIVMMIFAVRRKMETINIFLFGFVVFSFTVFNDIFSHLSLIETMYLVHFGLFVFIFSQAFLLSKRFSQAFVKSEELTKELTEFNARLENLVEARTSEVKTQKNQIEKQVEILEKSYEKLKKLEKFKEGMTSMIVHDLKNPLNTIINAKQVNKRDQYNDIVKAGNQMQNIILNLLDIQKYENSELTVDMQTVALTLLIKSSLENVNLLIEDKNLKVVPQIPLGIYVRADNEIIIRVLINLLTNAIKYSPLNETINISANFEKGKVRIEITDYGSGIPQEYQHLIFEKFTQFNEKKSGKLKSTGLGLAFCKIAIDAHCGKIGFVSKVGIGSTFWIELNGTTQIQANQNEIKLTQNQQSKNIQLGYQEYEIMKPYRNKLEKLEIYKITELREIINRIPENSDNIRTLKYKLSKAVITQNKKQFEELLRSIKISD